MRAIFLTCLLLSVASPAGAEGTRKIISIPEEAPGEEAIKQSFSGKFGAVRVIHSEDKKHVVFAHDRASGVVLEDIYAYERREDTWVLIGMAKGSRRACSSVSAKNGSVAILDAEKEDIVRFYLR